ncbi:MAG: hypothetical protein CMH83_21705 [Nocardioides sp.]|nr:hypothetical protein [Nocardioides sp.]
MRGLRRTPRVARPEIVVAAGEKVLAWAPVRDGEAVDGVAGAVVDRVVAGTRDALYLPDGTRLAWEDVEAADWDSDAETLRVSEVGEWGAPRAEHRHVLDDAIRLLQLVRERVTASVLLQRHVPVTGRRGLRVIARRRPAGGPVRWFFEYDEGVDADDPAVRLVAAEALATLKADSGLD